MDPEDREPARVRELRLEGIGLALIAAVVIAGLVAAFFVGRWYERGRGVSPAGGSPTSGVVGPGTAGEDPGDGGVTRAEKDLDYFDTLAGEEKELETRREARPAPAAVQPAEQSPSPAGDTAPGGPWYAQVFAGRDRLSAEKLAAELKGLGLPVKMHTVREGQGSLYKVGVGGYQSRDEAEQAANDLKSKGHPGAFANRFD